MSESEIGDFLVLKEFIIFPSFNNTEVIFNDVDKLNNVPNANKYKYKNKECTFQSGM